MEKHEYESTSEHIAGVSRPAHQLLELIKQLIHEQAYGGVALLFTSDVKKAQNFSLVGDVALELYKDVCLKHLTDENNEKNPRLYSCIEELLKVVAANGPADELLLELLELFEEYKSENMFTSTLRALQVVLLRLHEKKPRSLEWSLNSIHGRLEELPLPPILSSGYDEQQQALLEQDELVESLLMHCVTIDYFCEPLISEVCRTNATREGYFRDCSLNSSNVLCCFLIKMLGRPLALLDLSTDTRKSNSYTMQCARNISKSVTHCIRDPLYFLTIVEQRVRWKRALNMSQDSYEMNNNNFFLTEERLPLVGLGIYYYMVFVESVSKMYAPKIYSPLYLLECGLYICMELVSQCEPPLQTHGIRLLSCLLDSIQDSELTDAFLELPVHKNLFSTLCHIIGYSVHLHLRKLGTRLLRQYMGKFNDKAKYIVIKNLLCTIEHPGMAGFLGGLYKDYVAVALKNSTDSLPPSYSGNDFRSISMQHIYHLARGVETDMIQNSDKIICALNSIRFYAQFDDENRTGFWDFAADVEREFIEPLRQGIHISVAHYKAELDRVKNSNYNAEEEAEKLRFLDVNIGNASEEKAELSRESKINNIKLSLTTFELMRSLLSYAIVNMERKRKKISDTPSTESVV